MIVTLSPMPDMAPVPRMEIRIDPLVEYSGGTAASVGADALSGGSAAATGPTITGGSASLVSIEVPDGADTVTLWRTTHGRSFKVRGAVSRAFGDAFAVLDHEAPFTHSTYEAEFFSGAVPLGRVSLGGAALPWEGPKNGVVIQQPLDPFRSAVVTNLQGSWPRLTRSAPGSLVAIEGAPYPRLVSSGPRSGLMGVDVEFAVEDRDAARRVWATLGTEGDPQLPAWLVRSADGFLPPVFFGHVGTLEEEGANVRYGGGWSIFRAQLDEIEPPAPGLVVSPLSYADLDAAYASYAERDAAYVSYHEMDTDWSLAGAAGGA